MNPKIREGRLELYESLTDEARVPVSALAMVLRTEVKIRNSRVMFGEQDSVELAPALIEYLFAKGQI
jgi:hypothetical protein